MTLVEWYRNVLYHKKVELKHDNAERGVWNDFFLSASSKSHEQVTPSVVHHLKRLAPTVECRMKTLTERKWTVLLSGQILRQDYKNSNNDNRSWNLQRCGGILFHFFPKPVSFWHVATVPATDCSFFLTGIIVYFTFILYFHIRRRGLCPISWISSLLLTAILTAQRLLLLLLLLLS